MNLSEARREFPGTADKAFLDAACVSLAPRCAADAIRSFLDDALECPAESSSAHHVQMDKKRREAVGEAARLLRCSPAEVALVESTTHGLNIVAAGLPLPEGSNVLISDLEFLQVAIPWAVQRDRGIEVRAVPNRGGRVTVEDFARAADRNTRMIVISSVQWCNGWKCDLEALGRFAREHGILFVVDSIQQLGAIDIDLEAANVDVMVAGGHKWLNAPFGCGVMYTRREIAGMMKPSYWGYLNLTEPEGGWPAYFATPTISPVRSYTFLDTAQRFEIGGTSNYPGAIGLAASLKLINAIGIDNIQRHVLELGEYCIEGLMEAGARVITHPQREHRSGIVVFRFYDDLGEEMRLLDRLHRNRVYVAMRFTSNVGGIRVSVHFFNNRQDVDMLLDELRKAAAEKAPDYAG